jgi:two-component system, NtrC family, response regulator AtoC
VSRVLIVEDEPIIRSELRRLVARAGHDVSEAGSVAEAQTNFEVDAFDLVLTDLRLPGTPGTELISLAAPAPVIVMTSYATVRSAVDAMRNGAVDYIAKPFDHDELMLLVERWLAVARNDRKVRALEQDVSRRYPIAGVIGESPQMTEVFARIRKVAVTDATVLIRGESGTGKELVARAIHEHSTRKNAALVAVNCAAIPEGLLESELFGHERGAFTGAAAAHTGLVEAATGGTLFLDEIGELPPNAQARLLRVLQEGEVRRVGATRTRRVDVRLIAATHRDLPEMVRSGQFREDLYHRLRVLEIFVPALRERGSDVALLAQHFLKRLALDLGKPVPALSPAAHAMLSSHRWPGNVRELHNALERAVILWDDGPITPALLAIESGLGARAEEAQVPADSALFADSEPPPGPDAPELLDGALATPIESGDTIEAYLRRYVLDHQDHQSETELAKRLGISRKTLWERRARLGIPRPRSSGGS